MEHQEILLMTALPDDLKTIIDSKAFAHLTTLDPDGTPQSSAMWITRDGDHILFNTARGRRKDRNMTADSRVSVSISPVDDPYVNWSIQGTVVEMRESDGVDVIDALARKYTDSDHYEWLTPGMVRVTVVVEPTRVATNH
jgi:PPOX class probable F420-dependent enzyme